ncbi:hypothetical protein Bca4012_051339 [Brassica carinata]|uniref:BnaC02g29880D protein n=1 Tax=Brassica napus TaxID=3708 RepID=A0A078FIH0_BRANA|nr:BnaC02g29880D [Brassica napus]
MQHLIGILVLSYKYGLTRVHEHFEALLKTLQSSEPFSYSLVPQPFMSIIRGHTSNSHSWRERGFFVRINSASVEESGIPIFLGNILPLFPEDMIATRNLLRSADPVEVVEEETDSDMGDAVPQDVPIGDGKRKGKGIDLDDIEFSADGFPLPGWDPGFVPGDGSITSEMPLPDCDFENLFSNLPPGFDSYQEARVFRFKAEEAERQLALLRSKASARNERLAGDHAKALRHAERKGMSNYAAMVEARASQFKAEYQQLKEA